MNYKLHNFKVFLNMCPTNWLFFFQKTQLRQCMFNNDTFRGTKFPHVSRCEHNNSTHVFLLQSIFLTIIAVKVVVKISNLLNKSAKNITVFQTTIIFISISNVFLAIDQNFLDTTDFSGKNNIKFVVACVQDSVLF